MSSKLVVLDLDGTLISTNSFRMWILFLVRKLPIIEKNRLLFIKAIIFRIIGLYDRSAMKKDILILSSGLDNSLYIEFAKSLMPYIRDEIYSHVKILKINGYRVIVNTAAPRLYVEPLCEILGLEYVATEFQTSEVWEENIGRRKVVQLLSYLSEDDYTQLDIEVFYTDHYDDIPMAKISKMTYLVNPSKKTLNRFSNLKYIKYAVLNDLKENV